MIGAARHADALPLFLELHCLPALIALLVDGCYSPVLCNSAVFVLHFSSLTRGGNSFPASGVMTPIDRSIVCTAQSASCPEC
ncbi:hypothetical protein L207DRAFT_520949, partial [Hyaloscypha variabilis F]